MVCFFLLLLSVLSLHVLTFLLFGLSAGWPAGTYTCSPLSCLLLELSPVAYPPLLPSSSRWIVSSGLRARLLFSSPVGSSFPAVLCQVLPPFLARGPARHDGSTQDPDGLARFLWFLRYPPFLFPLCVCFGLVLRRFAVALVRFSGLTGFPRYSLVG